MYTRMSRWLKYRKAYLVRKAVVKKYSDTEGLAPGKSDIWQMGRQKGERVKSWWT